MDNKERAEKFKKILDEIQDTFSGVKDNIDQQIERTWNETDYNTKLFIIAYVFKQLEKHMYEGGSYRNLIYTKLGLESDAYGVLQMNGAFDIHNEVSGIWNKQE